MSDKNKFLMQIPHFGNLYVYKILYNYIYPRIFIVTNDAGDKILIYEMMNKYNHQEKDLWLAVPIGEEVYDGLIKGLISIQDAFLYRIFCFCIIYDYKKKMASISYDAEDFINKLPIEPLYVKKDDNDNYYSVE